MEVRLFRREVEGWAVFLLVSLWTSMDEIRAYAGSTPEVAVVYPEDERFELVADRRVTHYEVLEYRE